MSILYFTNIREEFTKNWNKYTISLMGWLTVVLENMCNCASYSISVTVVVGCTYLITHNLPRERKLSVQLLSSGITMLDWQLCWVATTSTES